MTQSYASQIREGSEPTAEDMVGLAKALATPEGRAKYDDLVRRAGRADNHRERDSLIFHSLHFWKGEFFQPGRNRFLAAHQGRTHLSDRVTFEDGTEVNVSDLRSMEGADSAFATDMFDPLAHQEAMRRDGRISDHTASRAVVGFLDSSDSTSDPSTMIGSACTIRFLIDQCSKAGYLPHLFLLLNHWKLEVPSFVELSRHERITWAGIQAAQEDTEGSSNVRQVAETYGIENFVPCRVTKKIVKAITTQTGLTSGQVVDMLGGPA